MTAVIRPSRSSGLGLARELSARAEGYTCIAGLDEVGRGPLAGSETTGRSGRLDSAPVEGSGPGSAQAPALGTRASPPRRDEAEKRVGSDDRGA